MSSQRYSELRELRDVNAELLKELKFSRQYVQANHAIIAAAIGHEDTIVKPDLDRVDAVIAKAEKLK